MLVFLKHERCIPHSIALLRHELNPSPWATSEVVEGVGCWVHLDLEVLTAERSVGERGSVREGSEELYSAGCMGLKCK